ncbi:MAG: hypothetical protein ACOCV3_02915 [Halanaerobiales bacterium]
MDYQSQSNQQQRQPLHQPPDYITTKDLAYLEDALSWELTAMKKCKQLVNQCQNQQVRKVFEKAGKMHQHHYEVLLSHIDPGKAKPNY